jgi:hypothetical protein
VSRETRDWLVQQSCFISTELLRTTIKNASGLLGAKRIGVLFIGLAAREQQQDIGERARKKARYLGKKLVDQRSGPWRDLSRAELKKSNGNRTIQRVRSMKTWALLAVSMMGIRLSVKSSLKAAVEMSQGAIRG